MELPDLSGLPGWAQVLAYITLAITLGATVGVGRLGFKRGRSTPPEDRRNAAEVAAVVVDSSVLKELNESAKAIGSSLGRVADLMASMVASEREDQEQREIDERVTREVNRQLKEQRGRQRRANQRPSPNQTK